MLKVTILIFFAATKSSCVNVVSEYFLEAGGFGHCGDTKNVEDSVFVKSHVGAGTFGGIFLYSESVNCEIQVDTDISKKLLIQSKFFDLEDSNTGCKDYIVIEGGSPICSEPDPVVSATHQVTIKFVSDASNNKKGFSLLMTSFHTGTCTDEEFQCDTDRCISSDLTCDGLTHCVDGSDESKVTTGCTLLDDGLGRITSMGKYGVLAIAAIGGAVLFTIFLLILTWKFMGPKSSCSCSSRDDDDDDVEQQAEPPVKTMMRRKSSLQPTGHAGKSAKMKKKKSVTITIADKLPVPLPAVEVPTVSKSGKRGQKRSHIQPVVTAESDW